MQQPLDSNILVCGQIAPDEVAGLKAKGITMIVNNRPDHEDPDQPMGIEIEAAAHAAGIAYRHVPIVRGIGPSDVEAMKEAMADAGDGKTLAYCRSGTRSAMVSALAQRELGATREEVEERLAKAGFDSSPIQHLL